MVTKTITLYEFDELSDDAKEKARDWWRELYEFNSHGDDLEPVETAARLLGIEFRRHDVGLCGGGKRSEPNIWWTLHVQGAGASFDATYSYRKGSLSAIKSEFPKDTALHNIADGLAHLQVRYGYKITALIKSDSRGHFLEIEVDRMSDADDEAMRELFRDFARWIYKFVDAEYTYQTSDEAVDDAIRANEYTFTEAGNREDA